MDIQWDGETWTVSLTAGESKEYESLDPTDAIHDGIKCGVVGQVIARYVPEVKVAEALAMLRKPITVLAHTGDELEEWHLPFYSWPRGPQRPHRKEMTMEHFEAPQYELVLGADDDAQGEPLDPSGYGVHIRNPDDVVHLDVISQIGNVYYDCALCVYEHVGDSSGGNLAYGLSEVTCPACLEAAQGAKRDVVSGDMDTKETATGKACVTPSPSLDLGIPAGAVLTELIGSVLLTAIDAIAAPCHAGEEATLAWWDAAICRGLAALDPEQAQAVAALFAHWRAQLDETQGRT
jgi:hypothetical protein